MWGRHLGGKRMIGGHMRDFVRRRYVAFQLFAALALLVQPTAASAAPLHPIAPDTKPGLIQRVAVFGKDTRTSLPKELEFLADSIGLVSSEMARSVCTGFCVGRRTIATAAHCLYRTAGERRPALGTYRFEVGLNPRRSSRIAGFDTGAVGQNVLAGSQEVNIKPPIDATRDWALARLARPVCAGHELVVEDISPTRVHRLAARGRLLHVAYHGDLRDWRLAVVRNCETLAELKEPVRQQIQRAFADSQSLLLHKCDTGQASSGSPLLAIDSERRIRAVALNVGTYLQTRLLVAGNEVRRRFKAAPLGNTAVSGSAFARYIGPFTRAELLVGRNAISELQSTLTQLGYDPGTPDGLYGNRTRAAVTKFARDAAIAGPVLPTEAFLRRLQRAAEAVAQSSR